MKRFLSIILVVSLSLLFLGISIEVNSYNLKYFERAFDKYDVAYATGLEMDQLMEISKDLVDYIKHEGEEELLEPHFNEREIAHMIDVQALFDLCRSVVKISLIMSILIIAYMCVKKDLKLMFNILKKGFFINYILLGIIGILAYFDFTKYFEYFHMIFFNNDLWLLDPRTDLMIQMLPEPFFIGMAVNILITFVGLCLLTQLLSYIISRRYYFNRE